MPRWTEQMKERVLALKGTKPIRQIAEELGVSKTYVGLVLKRDGAPEPMPEPTPEATEIIPTTTIEMIGDKEASDFLKSVGEGRTEVAERPSEFVDSLMAGIPIAEHITPPFKARRKPQNQTQVVPKTPKPRAVREPKPQAVPDDPARKAELIGRIAFNVNTFESLLGDVIKGDKDRFLTGLEKQGVASLEITLKTIETTRSVKNLSNQFLQVFSIGSSFVEMGTQRYLGMKTQGFTQAMLQTQQEELRLIMTELAMEQKDKFQKIQRPEVRLAMIMTTTLMAVSTQNSLASLKAKQGQPKPEQKPENTKPASLIPEDKVNDYKDL